MAALQFHVRHMNFSDIPSAAELSGSDDVTIANMKRGLYTNAIGIVGASKIEGILGYTMIWVSLPSVKLLPDDLRPVSVSQHRENSANTK